MPGGAARIRRAPARSSLAVEPLVENGKAVSVSVAVDGVAPAEVATLAIINQRNPQPDVVRFAIGPLAAAARAVTRIRLATSQLAAAVAKLAAGSAALIDTALIDPPLR